MADRAKKKEKQRLKREKKRRTYRKVLSITPLQHLGHQRGTLECLVSDDQQGLISLFALGTAPDGRQAMSVFLIDTWCVGLKEAFGRTQASGEEYLNMIKHARKVMSLSRIEPDRARDLVASAVRFSRQNGFKLPAGWEKWASIFGGPGDTANADISAFGRDGGLFYVGTEKFLRENLINFSSLQEFMSRPGVHVVINIGPGAFRNDADDYTDDDDDFDDDETDDPSAPGGDEPSDD